MALRFSGLASRCGRWWRDWKPKLQAVPESVLKQPSPVIGATITSLTACVWGYVLHDLTVSEGEALRRQMAAEAESLRRAKEEKEKRREQNKSLLELSKWRLHLKDEIQGAKAQLSRERGMDPEDPSELVRRDVVELMALVERVERSVDNGQISDEDVHEHWSWMGNMVLSSRLGLLEYTESPKGWKRFGSFMKRASKLACNDPPFPGSIGWWTDIALYIKQMEERNSIDLITACKECKTTKTGPDFKKCIRNHFGLLSAKEMEDMLKAAEQNDEIKKDDLQATTPTL